MVSQGTGLVWLSEWLKMVRKGVVAPCHRLRVQRASTTLSFCSVSLSVGSRSQTLFVAATNSPAYLYFLPSLVADPKGNRARVSLSLSDAKYYAYCFWISMLTMNSKAARSQDNWRQLATSTEHHGCHDIVANNLSLRIGPRTVQWAHLPVDRMFSAFHRVRQLGGTA